MRFQVAAFWSFCVNRFWLYEIIIYFIHLHYVTLPPVGPYTLYITLLIMSLLGRWSTSGSEGGKHISCHYKNTIKGAGENRRTNEQTRTMLGVNSEQKESMQHYISDSIYGLTLAWITSENSTKQWECRHLDSVFFTGSYLMLARLSARVSRVDRISPCRLANSFPWFHANCCQLLSPTNSLLASRYLFRPRRDFKSKNSLSGFAPKQTKESSAWRATYIVLQLNHLLTKNWHSHLF